MTYAVDPAATLTAEEIDAAVERAKALATARNVAICLATERAESEARRKAKASKRAAAAKAERERVRRERTEANALRALVKICDRVRRSCERADPRILSGALDLADVGYPGFGRTQGPRR